MPQQSYEQSYGGYIALLTVLVLSSAVTATGAGLLLVLPLAQHAVDSVQQTEQARLVAHGCARLVEYMRRVEGYENVAEVGMVFTGVGECKVIADEVQSGDMRLVHVRSTVRSAIVDLRVLIDPISQEIRAQSESP